MNFKYKNVGLEVIGYTYIATESCNHLIPDNDSKLNSVSNLYVIRLLD